MTLNSACACARDTPGFRRPKILPTRGSWPPGVKAKGTSKLPLPRSVTAGSKTPTTVCGWPSIGICLPTILGSLWKRPIHSRCVMMATRSFPGMPSSGRKSRPTATRSPRVLEKKPGMAKTPWIGSSEGSGSVRCSATQGPKSSRSKDLLWLRYCK